MWVFYGLLIRLGQNGKPVVVWHSLGGIPADQIIITRYLAGV